MKIKAFFLSVTLVVFFATSLHSQEKKIYKHPTQDFSFAATGEWQQNTNHKDKMIYEMVNHDRDVHVMLWYNGGTENTCEKYLMKMADMKGLQCIDPLQKEINHKSIWVLACTDDDKKINEKRILAAMSYSKPYGKDAPERCQGKSYNAMHIAQIWCPASKYEKNKEYINDIIASLELIQH